MDAPTGHLARPAPLLGSLAAVGLAAALIVAIPALVGVSWSEIGADLGHVPPLQLAGLAELYVVSLLVHAPVLKAAMPGLTGRQALTLNLSGSAVSNVLPLGGPAGTGLGFAMARGWGFTPESYTSFTVSTNLWSMAGRFVTGATVLAIAAVAGSALPTGIGVIVLAATGVVLLVAVTCVVTLRSARAAAAVGARLDRILRRVRPGRGGAGCAAWLLASRVELLADLRRSWKTMATGGLVYLALQATLLWACLRAAGTAPPVGVVAVTFAVERMISLAPITPGATGITEVGTIAALHSFGIDPVSAAAGVLLYRIFMFALDIPVGGVLALRWLRSVRRRVVQVDAAPGSCPVDARTGTVALTDQDLPTLGLSLPG